MNQQDKTSSGSTTYHLQLRQYGWQVLGMTLLGSALGLLAGMVTAPPGLIGMAAGVVAGIVVLTPLGLMLGLLGGRWQESLFCGLVGLGLGTLAGTLGDPAKTRFFAAVGLIYGEILGATFVSFFYRLPRLVFGLIRQLA